MSYPDFLAIQLIGKLIEVLWIVRPNFVKIQI